MECGTNNKIWNMVFKWKRASLHTQPIISMGWVLLFELHKYIKCEAQMKKWKLMLTAIKKDG
jgi:hypothetical protein